VKLSKTNFILGLFIIFVLFLVGKSGANVLKTFNEIENPPAKADVKVCPLKTPEDFKGVKDGEYLYALYRYESLGVKCGKQ
jgi:hypothetical protein